LTLSLLEIDDKREFSRKMVFEQQLPYLLVRISTSYYVKLGTLMKTYNLLQSSDNFKDIKDTAFKYSQLHFPKSMIKPATKVNLVKYS